MTLRVLNDRERLIETHRLIVQRRRRERRQVMTFEIRAGISDERKAGRMRFGKSVKRERGDLFDNFILRPIRNSLLRHAPAQLHFNFFHALL